MKQISRITSLATLFAVGIFTAIFLLCETTQVQAANSLSTASGAYVIVPYNSSLNVTNNNLTVECWFNCVAPPVGADQWCALVSNESNSYSFDGWDLMFGGLSPYGNFLANPYLPDPAVAVTTTNQWHHYAMEYNGTNFIIWVDGILGCSNNFVSQLVNTVHPVSIGCQNSGFREFNGYITEVRISRIARYTGTFIPQTRFANDSNTIALYHFDEGQGTNVADASGNGNNGTIQGTGAWSTNVPVQPTSQQSFLTNGLVAYYQFNGNANDSSGNGNNLSVFNATLSTDRFGQPSSAYNFNGIQGANGSTILGTNSVLNLGQAGYTIQFWFKPDNITQVTRCMLATVDSNGNADTGLGIDFNNNNAPGYVDTYIGAGNSDNNWSLLNQFGVKNNYQAGQWYCLTLTKSNSVYNLYINGISDNSFSNPSAATYNKSSLIRLSGIDNAGDEVFAGSIDDVRIYTRALSSIEVAQLYAMESVPTVSPPNIVNHPSSLTNNLGDNIGLSINASGSFPMDFQWHFSGTNIDNGTNSTLVISNIQQPFFGNYFVVVTNAFSSVTSSIVTIFEPATVINQPANLVVPFQSLATFSVLAVGYPAPNYFQWTLNGTNISGANSNSLMIPSVKLTDTGNYQVMVGNSISTTNSFVATLDMSPSITSPFIGATPIWGRNATFSVGAIGNGTLSYQWYFNGQPITGAVLPQLDFASIQLTNSGFYSVIITSPYGSVTNNAYQVAVSPAVVTLAFYPGLTINGAAGNSYIIRRSTDLSNTNNWKTVSNLTMYQPVELWVDTSVDATSPFNNMYFYELIPQ